MHENTVWHTYILFEYYEGTILQTNIGQYYRIRLTNIPNK